MNKDRLRELLANFPSRRIAVIGDFFLDKYLEYDPTIAEFSIETGKTANQVVNIRHSPGAAGTVVCNLAALGAGTIVPIGFSGDDGEGYELRQDLAALGCKMDYIFAVRERHTPTYLKPRNIRVAGLDGENERYDTKNRQPLPQQMQSSLLESLGRMVSEVDAVIVMDQVEEENCGAITATTREFIEGLAGKHANVVFWADSRRRIAEFSKVIIKPNQYEAVAAAFPGHSEPITDEMVLNAGRYLTTKTGRPVFVTRGERGMLVFESTDVQMVRGVRIEGPTDPTGAGDSATASAVLALASGGSLAEAAIVANLVASITVQQIGTTGTATPRQVIDRLDPWHACAADQDVS